MNSRVVRRCLCSLLVGLAALAVWPAVALAGTLSSQAATNVQVTSATLNGTSSGFAAGDYCAFLFVNAQSANGPPTSAPTGPATPCGTTTPVSYSYQLTGLTPGDTYYYGTAQCASTTTSNGQVYCAPTYSYPWGYAQLDPCWSNWSTCPQFTLGLPTGNTVAATAVKGTSATLNAGISVQDEDPSLVSYWFEYSTDPSLVASTSTPSTPLSSATPGPIYPASQSVTGLTPGTTYYYRVVVQSGETDKGPTYGNIVSFTTGGFVRTDPATSVTATTATLNGEVDAGDNAIGYSWLYSTHGDVSAGVLDNATTSLPGGTVTAGSDQNVSVPVSGLSSDTTYYFQLVSSDPAIQGKVVTLTTLPASCGSAHYMKDQAISGTGFLVTGCFDIASGTYTGHGTVGINGTTFTGPSSGTVTIDTSNSTISTSTPYDVDVGTVRMYDGAISGALDKQFVTTSGTPTTSAFDLGATDTSQSLYDLPLGGYARMTASSAGGATVEISALGLPSLFGGVTADGRVGVGEDGTVQQVHAQLGDSMIGPMMLPGFKLDGDPQTNTWSGDVNLELPLAAAGFSVNVEIKDGKLNGFGGSIVTPGIALDESGLFLDGGYFDTVFSPLTLQGGLDVSFGPKLFGVDLMDIYAGFYAGFNQDQTLNGLPGLADGTVLHDVPFTLGINGTLNLLGFIQLVSTSYYYYGVPGWPFVAMHSQLAQPLNIGCGTYGLGYGPSVSLAGDARGTDFNLVGSGSAALDLCAFRISIGVSAAISNVGLVLCGSFDGNSVGAGFTWPDPVTSFASITSNFHLYGSGCNVGNYEQAISFAPSLARPASVPTVRLPRGLPFAVVRVRGIGAPPLLSVHEPGGHTIVMSGLNGVTVAHAGYLIIPDAGDDTTYVELTRPAAGHYTIATQPGSAAIASLSVAHGEPSPHVVAHLGVSGRYRVLTWLSRAIPGQRLAFREIGAGGDRLLLSTTRTTGRLRYRPAPSVAGPRYIVADVYENGMLAKTVRLAGFHGPTIGMPHAPRRLTARRRRTLLSVRWRSAGASIEHYLVFVVTPDGRHRLFISRATRFLLRRVPARGAIHVTVTGVNTLGVRGPSSSTGLARTKRRRH